ncbi:MAG: hypothetical protein EPN51_11540 [Mycobacterium sp.]|nr:MAG: hypothetical protein EPN51_11540 [Mycobacterium sp.]
MGHCKGNVRDQEFNFFEMLGLEKILPTGAFGDLDGDAGTSARHLAIEGGHGAPATARNNWRDDARRPFPVLAARPPAPYNYRRSSEILRAEPAKGRYASTTVGTWIRCVW